MTEEEIYQKINLLEEKKIKLLIEKQKTLEELAPYKDRMRGFKKTVLLEGRYTNPAIYKAVEKEIRNLGAIDQRIAFELSMIKIELKKLNRLRKEIENNDNLR